AALAGPLDVAVFLTGVGAGLTLELARRTGREEDLRAALDAGRVIARGPKPRATLRAAGVRVDEVADPPHATAIRDALLAGGVAGRRILLQAYGAPVDEVAGPLRDAGAEVTVVSPYQGGWPDDQGPAQELARAAAAGELDALTFTSAQAARQFVVLAECAGVDVEALRASGVTIAAVGPVTRAALEAAGLPVHVEPENARMGAMYHALAAVLPSRAPMCTDHTRDGTGISAGPSEVPETPPS
ncbi:MAG: uroporphyrinogen-III synthase, partial [Actinomycetota bacterium]